MHHFRVGGGMSPDEGLAFITKVSQAPLLSCRAAARRFTINAENQFGFR
jgi:hypothetical protein